MKMKYISLSAGICALLLSLAGCTPAEPVCTLGPVTNITWEPTSGGAIITFTAPKDNNLLYVKAAYVNSLGESVYNVCSVYDNKIEISGLIDDSEKVPVQISAIDKNGGESPVETIYITPGRAYLNIVKDNIQFNTIIGGLNIKWHNPSGAVSGGKTIHVVLNYETDEGPQTRFISSSQEYVDVNVRGVPPGEWSFSYTLEDQIGNKIPESAPMTFEIMEELNVPKFIDDAQGYRTWIWTLVDEQTTLREVWENKNAAVFDGVIDTAGNADDNSYAGTDCVEAGYGSTMPWDTDQLDIVIDMHQVVNISLAACLLVRLGRYRLLVEYGRYLHHRVLLLLEQPQVVQALWLDGREGLVPHPALRHRHQHDGGTAPGEQGLDQRRRAAPFQRRRLRALRTDQRVPRDRPRRPCLGAGNPVRRRALHPNPFHVQLGYQSHGMLRPVRDRDLRRPCGEVVLASKRACI